MVDLGRLDRFPIWWARRSHILSLAMKVRYYTLSLSYIREQHTSLRYIYNIGEDLQQTAHGRDAREGQESKSYSSCMHRN